MKMTAQEYRDALEKLEMSQVAAGELFEVGARTSRRWALDETRIPFAVAIVLRQMLGKQVKLEAPTLYHEETRRVWTLSATSKLK